MAPSAERDRDVNSARGVCDRVLQVITSHQPVILGRPEAEPNIACEGWVGRGVARRVDDRWGSNPARAKLRPCLLPDGSREFGRYPLEAVRKAFRCFAKIDAAPHRRCGAGLIKRGCAALGIISAR